MFLLKTILRKTQRSSINQSVLIVDTIFAKRIRIGVEVVEIEMLLSFLVTRRMLFERLDKVRVAPPFISQPKFLSRLTTHPYTA